MDPERDKHHILNVDAKNDAQGFSISIVGLIQDAEEILPVCCAGR